MDERFSTSEASKKIVPSSTPLVIDVEEIMFGVDIS
jgi:hypothetical protein